MRLECLKKSHFTKGMVKQVRNGETFEVSDAVGSQLLADYNDQTMEDPKGNIIKVPDGFRVIGKQAKPISNKQVSSSQDK